MSAEITFTKILPTLTQESAGYSFSAKWARVPTQLRPMILWGLHYDPISGKTYDMEIDWPASGISLTPRSWSRGHHCAFFDYIGDTRIVGPLAPTITDEGVKFNEVFDLDSFRATALTSYKYINRRGYYFTFLPVVALEFYEAENSTSRVKITKSDSVRFILKNENRN